jgi:hypothetical protein
MTSDQKQTIDYIATLSADLARLAEGSNNAAIAYILRMAEMEARRLLSQDGAVVKHAA